MGIGDTPDRATIKVHAFYFIKYGCFSREANSRLECATLSLAALAQHPVLFFYEDIFPHERATPASSPRVTWAAR